MGDSPALKQVLAAAMRVAPSDSPVLIAGEPGSGKESIARAIHRISARRHESFVKIHSVTPPGLLEQNLLGKEKGAPHKAISAGTSRLELANKGTLFLDELARIPLDLQSRLLEVLKRGEFERSGNGNIRVNVRLIAATRHDLKELAENRLHQDLYDQIKTFSIQIPPLRERREDIPLLVQYFVQKFARRMNKEIRTIPSETMDALLNYDWPGNVTQLETFIKRSVMSGDSFRLQTPIDTL